MKRDCNIILKYPQNVTTITRFITVDFGVKLLLSFVIICVYVTLLIFFNITVSFLSFTLQSGLPNASLAQ